MQLRTATLTLALAAAGVMIGAGLADAAPVTVLNGGFENPVVPSANSFTANTTSLTDWTVAAGNVDILPSRYWQPHSGDQSIDLYGCEPSTIRQAITTVAGESYVLTFWVAGNPDSQTNVLRTATAKVGTTAGGSELATLGVTFDAAGKTHAAMGWESRSLSFTATGTTTYIQFNDTTASACYGLALDDVTVESVPPTDVPEVPLSVLLPLSGMAIGGVALWVASRRRPAGRRN